MAATLTRNSDAYSPTYHRYGIDAKVPDPLYESPFAFQTMTNLSHTYVDSTDVITFATVLSNLQALPTTYPGRAVYEKIGESFNGQDLGTVRIDDDGVRPIMLIMGSMHGDETFWQRAGFDFIDHWMTTDHPVLNLARDKLSLLFFPAFNPDGQTATPNPTRDNAENININRNDLNFWDLTTHASKGSSANSATELVAFLAWIIDYIDRLGPALDCHSWGFSQNHWAFNMLQRFRDIRALRHQRSWYNHLLNLLDIQDIPNSGLKLFNATATHFNPDTGEYPREGLSWGKPFPADGINKRGLPQFVRLVAENPDNCPGDIPTGVPQYVNYDATKDDGESPAVAGIFYLNMFLAMTAATLEAMQPAVSGTLVAPAYDPPVNENSLIIDFNESQGEPSFWNFQKAVQQHFANGENGDFRSKVRVTLPDDSAWRDQRGRAAYTLVWNGDPDDTTNAFLVAGGRNPAADYLTSTHRLTLEAGATVPASVATLPKGLQYGAMANNGTNVWFVGGQTTGAVYNDEIYIASATNPTTWTLWHTLAGGGLHSMTAHCWTHPSTSVEYLVIVGGRRTGGQIAEVRTVQISDPGSKTENLLASLSTARNQHTSAIDTDDFLHVFGGWNGSSGESSVEKVDLVNATVSAGTSLPFARRWQAIAVRDRVAYLAFGIDSSGTHQTEVYAYDMSDDTVTTFNYDYCEAGEASDDDATGIDIEDPELESPVGFIYPSGTDLENTFLIALGEDESGTYRDQIYELELDDRILCLRATLGASRARMRTSVRYNIDDNVAAGDSFVWIVSARSAFPYHTSREPYIRIRSITTQAGGLLVDWVRSVRTGYQVLPEVGQDVHTYVLPFTLLEADPAIDETNGDEEAEFRCTIDLYGPGTSMDIFAAQIIRTSTGSPPSVVYKPPTRAPIPLTGKAADVFTEVFPQAVDSTQSEAREATGIFSPVFGCLQPYTVDCLDFTCDSGDLTELKLIYEGDEDYTNGTQFVNSAGNPTRTYWYPPTGNFKLQWDDGTPGSETFGDASPIWQVNYRRFDRTDRRDVFHWKLTSSLNQIVFTLWFYGLTYTKTFSSNASVISGHVATGTGITYSEMAATTTASRAGFSKLDGSDLTTFTVHPDSGSTDPYFGKDRRRNEWKGEHEQGAVVFMQSKGTWRTWRFIWEGISKTFFDTLQSFARLRLGFLLYPDTNLLNEFRVKCRQNRLPLIQQGDGKVSTTMELEHW